MLWFGATLLALTGCGGNAESDAKATGGVGASEEGGSSTATGGSGGTPATGGAKSSGGTGTSTGGKASSATGGAGTGGKASSATGGTSNGGNGAATGGSGGIAAVHPTAQLDILFMIDNSISMADKQALLGDAVPQLLTRLTTPSCVDASGIPNGMKASSDGKCAAGSPEFSPVNDIHVGVVTSSLGSHGGQTCASPDSDDKGQLLGKVRVDPTFPYQAWNDSGFLAWDPDHTRNTPPGESNLAAFASGLKNMILSANQTGCGYEASLEAWYRFLIDPDPPTLIPAVVDQTQTMPVVPTDPAQNPVLVQRAAFLRPDSALVIVMLSDENDCSIQDAGQGWLVGHQNAGGMVFHMPRARAVCETNPNDKCCVSCAAAAPAGCDTDPTCVAGNLTQLDDNLNLRCWDQKRRFGFDLLYPIARYVDGLTQPTIANRSGKLVANPLFPAGGRTPSMVFLTGIVGVPWQDLATVDSFPVGAQLKYLTHQQLSDQGRWSLVLGSPGDATTPPTRPGDNLMFETTKDRTTLFGNVAHPLVATTLAPATAMGQPNAINGHESNIADNSDLQYACIFPLPTVKDCASGAAACDCKTTDAPFNRAVCNGTTQTHAKAYPGIRELRLLKDFGDRTGNAITTSICPKTLSDSSSANYGYNPVFSALVNSLRPVLTH